MKKNILAAALLSGLVLSFAAPTALAVEDANGNSVEKSKVEVKLTKDTGHEEGTGPFKDKLAIVHKPTIFKFEEYTTTGALNLKNKHDLKDEQFISVNDDRKDANDKTKWISGNWDLTGELGELTDGGKKLPASMVFTPGELKKYDMGQNPDGKGDIKPLPIDKAAGAADTAKYNLAKTFTLDSEGTAVSFLKSTTPDVTDPHGVYTNLGDVELNIATGNAKTEGNYQGTITWTLAAQK